MPSPWRQRAVTLAGVLAGAAWVTLRFAADEGAWSAAAAEALRHRSDFVVPALAEGVARARAGTLAFWSPLAGTGLPRGAAPIGTLLAPWQLPALFLAPEDFARILSRVSLVLGAAGMVFWLRARRLSLPLALGAACLYAATPAVEAAAARADLPAVAGFPAAAALCAWGGRGGLRLPAAGLLFGSLLLGHPAEAVLTVAGAGLLLAPACGGGRAVWILLAALGVAAPTWLPGVAAWAELRPEALFEGGARWVAGLLFPAAQGVPAPFVGLAPLALLPYAPTGSGTGALRLLALAAVAAALFPPLPAWAPYLLAPPLAFAALTLAAEAAQRAAAPPLRRGRGGLAASCGCAAAAAWAAALVQAVAEHPAVTWRGLTAAPELAALRRTLAVELAGLAVVAAGWTLLGRRSRGGAFRVLFLLVALGTAWFRRGEAFLPPPAAPAPPAAPVAPGTPPPRALACGALFPPNRLHRAGWADLRLADPWRPPWWPRWLTREGGGPWWPAGPLASRLGVRTLFSSRPLGRALSLEVGPGERRRVPLRGARAGRLLAVYGRLLGASGLPQGTPVVRLRLTDAQGRSEVFLLRAGVETAVTADGGVAAHLLPPPAWWREGPRGPAAVYTALCRPRRVGGALRELSVAYLAPTGAFRLERLSPGTEVPGSAWAVGPELLLRRAGPLLVYENRRASRRAWFAWRAVVADGATGRRRLADPSWDPRVVVLEKPFTFEELPAVPSPPRTDKPFLHIRRYGPADILLEAGLPRPGFLVLTDTFARGWEATVQGEPWPVLKAFGWVRAVPLPAGGNPARPYRIRLRYTPPGLALGVALCLGAVLTLVLALARPWWRRPEGRA